jgi:streptogramin lyase
MKRAAATIVREYGPFPGVANVAGVSYDGTNVWMAAGDTLNAIDPASGETIRTLDIPAHAGTAFDGQHLFQISGDFIQKVDPDTGRVVATIPAPEGGASGMAWAEGSLWVGQYRKRKIHQVDPQTGAILRSLDSTASSPALPGSTASCGTAPGNPTRAKYGALIQTLARSSNSWTCRTG